MLSTSILLLALAIVTIVEVGRALHVTWTMRDLREHVAHAANGMWMGAITELGQAAAIIKHAHAGVILERKEILMAIAENAQQLVDALTAIAGEETAAKKSAVEAATASLNAELETAHTDLAAAKTELDAANAKAADLENQLHDAMAKVSGAVSTTATALGVTDPLATPAPAAPAA